MAADNLNHSELTEQIIGAAFAVHNKLGYGFLEKVYENALALQLRKVGLYVKQQVPVVVRFDSEVIGEYLADLLVENAVIAELKAVERLERIHEVQLVNYLKATGIEVGLLINFGRKVVVRRRIFTQIHHPE